MPKLTGEQVFPPYSIAQQPEQAPRRHKVSIFNIPLSLTQFSPRCSQLSGCREQEPTLYLPIHWHSNPDAHLPSDSSNHPSVVAHSPAMAANYWNAMTY